MVPTLSEEHLCLIYDGDFDGFLTAIFYCFDKKVIPCNIIRESDYRQSFFERSITIQTETPKAERVRKGLHGILDSVAVNKLFKAFLSREYLIEMHLYNFIKATFQKKEDTSMNYANASMLCIEKANKKVNREVHRMYAFVRFKKTSDNIFYAVIEPDFDVLLLISDHFEKRYADQQWLIYDAKRSYGMFYDMERTAVVKLTSSTVDEDSSLRVFDVKEEVYETLWRSYFNSVNITERKNTRLQLRHVPKRYWKYLSETKSKD